MIGEDYIRIFEKNGNFEFAVSGKIHELNDKQMREVRNKFTLALCRAQEMQERAAAVKRFQNRMAKAMESMAEVFRNAFPDMK